MKRRPPASVACCIALLIVTVPPMARAASKSLLLDAEPQYASKLCWAAADVLAVNHFYPSCPSPTSTPNGNPRALPHKPGTGSGLSRVERIGRGLQSFLHPPSEVCGPQIGNCNDWGLPLLHGLTFNTGFVGTPSITATTAWVSRGTPQDRRSTRAVRSCSCGTIPKTTPARSP